MPKGSAELTQARKDEIIDACAGLYEHMNFRDITIKEIGRATSFTRTSIYNYYQTKEEIFLALLQREYALWEQDLCAVAAGEALSRAQLAQALAAVPNMAEYDVVFVGFPIWWYVAPRIIETFLESYDFSGKTVVPFCTSGGSGVGGCDSKLHANCSAATNWRSGRLWNGDVTTDALRAWVDSLKL